MIAAAQQDLHEQTLTITRRTDYNLFQHKRLSDYPAAFLYVINILIYDILPTGSKKQAFSTTPCAFPHFPPTFPQVFFVLNVYLFIICTIIFDQAVFCSRTLSCELRLNMAHIEKILLFCLCIYDEYLYEAFLLFHICSKKFLTIKRLKKGKLKAERYYAPPGVLK